MMRRDEYCLLPGEFFLSGDVAEITQLLLHHWWSVETLVVYLSTFHTNFYNLYKSWSFPPTNNFQRKMFCEGGERNILEYSGIFIFGHGIFKLFDRHVLRLPLWTRVLFNYLHVTWWCGWSHLICHGLMRALHWISLCVFPLIEECVEPATKGDVSLLKQSSAHLFSMLAAWSPPTPPIGYLLLYLLYSGILQFILISCGGHTEFNYASFVMGIFDWSISQK